MNINRKPKLLYRCAHKTVSDLQLKIVNGLGEVVVRKTVDLFKAFTSQFSSLHLVCLVWKQLGKAALPLLFTNTLCFHIASSPLPCFTFSRHVLPSHIDWVFWRKVRPAIP